MRFFVPCLVLTLLLAANAAKAADPQTTVSIVGMDPPSPALLHSNDDVYVHLHYTSDAPIKIWARPFSAGTAAGAISSSSPVYPAGEGDAFGWFSCSKACSVDSIHVQIAVANSGYPFHEDSTSVGFGWDGAPGQRHTPAAWVKPMQDAVAAQEKQTYDAYMAQPLGKSGVMALILFDAVVLGALFVCVVWPVYGLTRWQGKWRWLASAPLALFILKTFGISTDLAHDPTSHNLLPFEYFIIGAIAAPYMILIWLLRRRALRRDTD
ncbi:MAG TPA: hypothetical protein VGN70_12735 [Gammaproteobacteria bacterium]